MEEPTDGPRHRPETSPVKPSVVHPSSLLSCLLPSLRLVLTGLPFAQLSLHPMPFLPSGERFLLRKSLAPRSGCSDLLGFVIPREGNGRSTKISYSPSIQTDFPIITPSKHRIFPDLPAVPVPKAAPSPGAALPRAVVAAPESLSAGRGVGLHPCPPIHGSAVRESALTGMRSDKLHPSLPQHQNPDFTKGVSVHGR